MYSAGKGSTVNQKQYICLSGVWSKSSQYCVTADKSVCLFPSWISNLLIAGEFDMRVKSCSAFTENSRPIDLSDEHGCVLRPKMISKFMKIAGADTRFVMTGEPRLGCARHDTQHFFVEPASSLTLSSTPSSSLTPWLLTSDAR